MATQKDVLDPMIVGLTVAHHPICNGTRVKRRLAGTEPQHRRRAWLKGRKGEGTVEPFATVIKCTSDLHRGDGAGIKSVRHRIGLRCARVNGPQGEQSVACSAALGLVILTS